MLDTRVVQDEIKRSIESLVRQPTAVVCPPRVARGKGIVFYCEIKVGGADPSKARVTQDDDDGDFHWEITH